MNIFTTADSVRVDSDERGFALIIDTEDGDKLYVNIQPCALDFYDSVRNEMRQWVAEAENTRAAVAAGRTLSDYLGVEVEPWLEEDDPGYSPDDPKHPTYHERMSEVYGD